MNASNPNVDEQSHADYSAYRNSIPAGDVLLANLPPYNTQPWLSMGVVLHYALLASAGIRARVLRPIDPPFKLPSVIEDGLLATYLFDPTLDERIERIEQLYAACPEPFDDIVKAILAGGERFVGLSVFRNSVDFTLWIARLVKRASPDTFIAIGGPEAIEDPELILLPWVDAVVGADAHAVIVPLVEAVLGGRIERAGSLRNIWLNPRLGLKAAPPRLRAPLDIPPFPTIDYRPILRLFVGDTEPTVPLLLNWGCPYNCGFCSNRNTYSRFGVGKIERVLDEIDAIVHEWGTLHEGTSIPGINLQLSDATTNALPKQFEALLEGFILRRPAWPANPRLRGQLLLDSRLTRRQVRLMIESGFSGAFFGLDSGSDAFRRQIGKPGKVADVAAALKLYHSEGARELNFGVPVGMPGETDEHFRETYEFVDWALGMKEAYQSVTVLPYVFFLSAQDPAYNRMNIGDKRGLLWRTDGPAGDPGERARRFMALFELVHGRALPLSPVPPYIALPAMLPDEDPARIERWLTRYGRQFDQLMPNAHHPLQRDKTSTPSLNADDRVPEPWSEVARIFRTSSPVAGWELEGLCLLDRPSEEGLVVAFRRTEGTDRACLLVERANPQKRSFACNEHYNLSYLKKFNNSNCVFDAPLMRWGARMLNARLAN